MRDALSLLKGLGLGLVAPWGLMLFFAAIFVFRANLVAGDPRPAGAVADRAGAVRIVSADGREFEQLCRGGCDDIVDTGVLQYGVLLRDDQGRRVRPAAGGDAR